MVEKLKIAAQKLLDLAHRDLEEMQVLFERDPYYGSVNRAYYAIFHAASALLVLDGKRFKKHSAVISFFGKEYVNTGVVPREYQDVFNKMFEIRNIVDYDYDAIVSREEAILHNERAKEMVDFLEKLVAERSKSISGN
jgi:hypothetical protein